MKTKNVKVRTKDIKQGVTVYVASPFYGIQKLVVASKPYPLYGAYSRELIGMAFDVYYCVGDNDYIKTYQFLSTCGITDDKEGNCRRTFFKHKHAKEWVKKAVGIESIDKAHNHHLKFVSDTYDFFDEYLD